MHTKRNICGSQRLITAGISEFVSSGGSWEDYQTYEMRYPLRLAITASQDFAYEHQLQTNDRLIAGLFLQIQAAGWRK